MKKVVIVLLCLVGLISISCGRSYNYSEEATYLPVHKNMTFQSVDKGEKENELTKIVYTMDNIDFENALAEYEETLTQDGWSIVTDSKPNLIEVKKDNHIATVIAYEKDNKVYLDIMTK
ncbi:hypothetical protein [Paramaledivibacter caminithermalis]|uniref:Lipoprotein n=1 Tax=Paramaledivibacter caminithermalis (strain DSM 15212 / CIP 107654 / DViRD3) TaxID=1121301 RepID=A0A1M6Q2M6_PARC5|nr:hypothetical protein [Paramaledivibacter caminithermalis]SHK14475.1 hypothetical protein SAMN02745912_02404 [Paramaledivibacter caminithermalis DSM 15212]